MTRTPRKKPTFRRNLTNNDENSTATSSQGGAQLESALVEEDYGLSLFSDRFPTMTYSNEELNCLCFEVDCATRSNYHVEQIALLLEDDC